MVILEFTAFTDGINILKNLFYSLEGDSKNILRANEVFKRLEHAIDNNYEWPPVNRVFNDVIGLILKKSDIFMHQKQNYSNKLDTSIFFLEANERVEGLNNKNK